MTRNRLDDQEIQVLRGQAHGLSEPNYTLLCLPGEAVYSLPTSTDVNNAWSLRLHSRKLIRDLVAHYILKQ